MKIIITENQKKKLFIPRKLSGEDSRWAQWNKEQPIVDGVRINQYDINTGKKEGIWEEYYDNGQLAYKGSYNNGDRDGIWEWYYDNGQLMYKGSYKNGKEEGYWEYYYSNGKLLYKGSFKSGELIKNINEAEKKKLFIPRNISGEDSRWADWNKDQPIKDGIRINQYDINTGKKEGIWEEYYHTDGKLLYRGSFKSGEKDGIWKWYHNNGQLAYKGSYKNGKKDGIWKEYYDNGKLWFKGSYKNDQKDGIWEKYYDNGQLDYKGSFNNGKKDGYWEEYFDNGQLMYKGSYKNGFRDGIWEWYFGNGKLHSSSSYKNGELIKKLDESEQPKKKLFIPRKLSGEDSRWAQWNKEQPIVDGLRINQYNINTGKKEGIWEKYYDNGQLMYKGSFNNGKKDGYWEWYFDNGQLMYKGSYKNGKEEGYWEEYYDNGQLAYKGSYKNGKLIKKLDESEQPKKKLFIPRKLSGEDSRWAQWNKEQPIVDGLRINQYNINTGKKQGIWEEYYDNGQLAYKGSYKNGKEEGIWKWYHNNGQLDYKGSYKNGFRDGIWEEYFSDGDFWYEGEWDNGKYIRDIRI
jgi:antitoxin component YwqK of YwqJK toxin-antitoxin module